MDSVAFNSTFLLHRHLHEFDKCVITERIGNFTMISVNIFHNDCEKARLPYISQFMKMAMHGSSDIETKEYSPKYIRGCGIHEASYGQEVKLVTRIVRKSL
jgi:hypothetical protein